MTKWQHRLDVSDVFRAETLTFTERRDKIVARIRKAAWFDENDFQLDDAVGGLAEAEDIEEFDGFWSDFYDWADSNSLWVATS